MQKQYICKSQWFRDKEEKDRGVFGIDSCDALDPKKIVVPDDKIDWINSVSKEYGKVQNYLMELYVKNN